MTATKIIQNSHGTESTLKVVEESLSKLDVSECICFDVLSYSCISSTVLSYFGGLCSLGYIDLYLIHSPLSGKEKRLQTYISLLKKRDDGKIRTVGVSN